MALYINSMDIISLAGRPCIEREAWGKIKLKFEKRIPRGGLSNDISPKADVRLLCFSLVIR
jgi:hypothetical protein